MARHTLNSEARAVVPTPSAGFVRGFPDSTYATAKPLIRWLNDDGTITSPVAQKGRLVVNPITDYGCKFDHRVVFDGACNVGSPGIITSATIAFTAADVNKRIVLSGAGAAGAQYVGTIQSLNSSSSVNVTPAVSTTVAAKGLQVHTDDLAAWTNLINDVNNSVYPGAVIQMEAAQLNAFGVSGFTNRSGISSFLPTITKQVRIEGIAAAGNADTGDYTKGGGSCIAFVGTSSAPTAFGAVMTIAPVTGATNQNLKQVTLAHFWIDCRNGDQNEALKGVSLQSCFGWTIEDFFVMDALAVAIEFTVIVPGTAGALGEAKDCSRGVARNVRVRMLDTTPGGVTTPVTTTSAITLSAVGQSLAGLGANTLPAAGYGWVESAQGTPVLVNWTGGGGSATLTGVTCSPTDAQYAYATVSGSNIVQAAVSNGCAIHGDGDQTANMNLSTFDTLIISHGTTWGPAAVEFCNSDSNEMTNVVINGGSSAATNAINRVTKPGVRFNGHTSAQFHSRNNVFKSGSAGAGGASHMAVNNAGALLAFYGPNYWDDYQLGNGEAIPTVEGNSYFAWTPNGGMQPAALAAPTSVADQAIAAATLTAITGSVMSVPPQGFQPGTTWRWIIEGTSGAVGTAANSIFVKIGTTGTSADATVATFTTGVGDATAAPFKIVITFTVRTIGAAATAIAYAEVVSGLLGVAHGFIAQLTNILQGVMATFNSTTAQQFISVALTTGASKTLTIQQSMCEVVKPANP